MIWILRIPMWGKIAVPAALAMTAAVVVISVGVLPHLGMNKAMNKASNSEAQYSSIAQDKNATTSQYKPGSQPQSTMSEGQSTPLQPTALNFTYQDISYTRSSGTLDSTKGYLKYLGEKIATINVQGTNQQTKEVNLYNIKNIDSEVAVAANYSSDSTTYYIYLNYSCHFHDIDDFVDLLSPATEIKIQKILYYDLTINDDKQAQYSSFVDTEIYDILFADGSIEGYTAMDYDYESSYKYYYIGFDIPAFVNYRFTAYFYDSGYIVFNLLGQNHIFELGQETYQAFASYVTSH